MIRVERKAYIRKMEKIEMKMCVLLRLVLRVLVVIRCG